MRHIVYVSIGMSSTLNSSLELSRRLVDAGMRVTYLSHADIGESLAANGFPFHRLTGHHAFTEAAVADPPPRDRSLRTPVRVLRWIRRRRRLRRESSRMLEFERVIRELAPDLLIIDSELHAAIITASTLAIPIVIGSAWFTMFRHSTIPPLESYAMPATGWLGRCHMQWLWARSVLTGRLLEWKARLRLEGVRNWLSPVMWDTLNIDDLRAVARARGFDLRRSSRTNWLRPLTYPDVPTFSFNLQEMDFPHEPHRSLHYVGPMIARERVEVRGGRASPAWDQFLERRAALDASRPLVYCSLGSHWAADQVFLRLVIDVFRRRPEWDLVLGLGAKLDPEALAPVPDNVLILPWAPQLRVLEVAHAAITHGGITTINECIAFGVPMVVYSTEYVDQNGCAARLAYHGLGVLGNRHRDDAADIERNIDTVLSDEAIRARVVAMRQRLIDVEQSGTAVRLISQLMPEPPGHSGAAPEQV